MSLDVHLEAAEPGPEGSGIFVRENGQMREISREEWDKTYPGREPVIATPFDRNYYSANITHNLGKMAAEAGLYEPMWRPEEIGATRANDLIEPLRVGLANLKADRAHFEQFNPKNGWGDYDGLVDFTERYLRACESNPSATIWVSR